MGVYDFLLRKKREWEERLLIHQKQAFFEWVNGKGMQPGEYVLLSFSDGSELYRFTEKGWKRTRGQQREPIRFLFCFKSTLSETWLSQSDWFSIFSSSLFEVWENRTYYKEKGLLLPLRLGLDQEEKESITQEVRRMIGDVLQNKEAHVSEELSKRLEEKQDLDVALWVNGHLRASVIMTGQSCKRALEVGAFRATCDSRFKPITLAELPSAYIEITFMSDLIMPLTLKEYVKNEIDSSKGYIVSLRGKKGWYLPEVHNVVSFSSLQELLSKMAKEKAGISSTLAEVSHHGQFEVFDWIESEKGVTTFTGPTEKTVLEKLSRERVKWVVNRAVEWLSNIQESDGNIPAAVSDTGVAKQLNFSALGCTGHALAKYGEIASDEKAQKTARKTYEYLKRYAPFEYLSGNSQRLSALVYFLRFSLALKETIEPMLFEEAVKAREQCVANPILSLQILSLLVDYERGGYGKRHHDVLLQGAEDSFEEFIKKREQSNVQIAFYPELVAVFHGLWELTGKSVWKDRALQMSAWYIAKQQVDGSFPHSPERFFAYTRGTGKIFEVLTCFPEENNEALERTFSWLRSMQYIKENTFWTDEEGRKWIEGGFRHDAFNREAWIDGAAHVILGTARWLKEEK